MVVTTGGEAFQADRLQKLADGNTEVAKLTYQLQTERTLAVRALLNESDDNGAEDFLNHTDKTEDAVDAYRKVKDQFTDVPKTTAGLLDRVDENLDGLDSVRDRVTGAKMSASSAAFVYRILIADLLTFRESVPQAGSVPSDVADRIRASNLLARSIEYQSIGTETVLRAIDAGELPEAEFQKITAAHTGSTDAALSFNALASAKWRGWLEQSQAGNKISEALGLEDEALRTVPGEEIAVEAEEWFEHMGLRAEQYQTVQEDIDDEILKEITTLRDDQYQWTYVQLGGVAIAVVIALLMAVWLGGPIVRGLHRLRDTAHRVATEDLPRAVAQLDERSDLDGRSPEEFASATTPPVSVKGRDELADVGRAFNEVHQEAVRVAAHQALLRLHIGGMFVRLARRGHSLAGRLTNVLDEAERDEQDPDRLARLFKLDHLVTLFGRTNDSLLVLGGAAPARVRRSDETVGDVLTASQSQIEQYTRVQIGMVDEGVSIKASSVDDVVKLLAELLDNATQYSQHQVNVTARLLADRMVVQISDRGMGMPPERIAQLNERMTSRRTLDLDSMQTMGLTVVGHIAARHGIHVELRSAAVGGTLAEVSLPVNIIEIASEPKAIAAVPEPVPEQATGIRKAPLFKRRPRQRQHAVDSPAAGHRPDNRTQRQHEPGSTVRRPDNGSQRARSTGGLPQIRFDFRSVPVDPGYAPPVDQRDAPTETMPAVPRQRDPNRPRRMDVGGMRSYEDSWHAAQRATSPIAAAAPDDVLPKRDPMSRLVPGAMGPASETPATHTAPAYRDPTAVGASYLAYAKTRPDKRSPFSPADDSRNES